MFLGKERNLEAVKKNFSDLIFEKAPFGCKSIVAKAKHWMVPVS